MSPIRLVRMFGVLLVPALMALGSAARAEDGGCCSSGFCCPRTTFCQTRAPHICFKKVCPKPICDPCTLEHFGYYHTCWRTWPFPPDYSHCCTPPPAQLAGVAAPEATGQPPAMPRVNGEELPTPHKDTLPDLGPGK
jgi:hypothetical protein